MTHKFQSGYSVGVIMIGCRVLVVFIYVNRLTCSGTAKVGNPQSCEVIYGYQPSVRSYHSV